ncbi:MAG: ABC transporter substrate-binding protein [Candidatus Portiera sp.]|nr:ABC transporter substrate-binding protein [Portiera sp.]
MIYLQLCLRGIKPMKALPAFTLTLLALILGSFTLVACSPSSETTTAQYTGDNWDKVLEEAQGQTVYWHAWGGSPTINSYISWVGEYVKETYDIELKQVKVKDTVNVVTQVLTEKTADKNTDGSVDMVWINGENFRAMKDNDLLFGPFATKMPNFKFVDTLNKPTTLVDFTVPTDGYESPWGMAQLNFIYDSARVISPPTSIEELLAYAKANPGRFAYPAPPDFMGSTFLKQVLYETMDDPSLLQQEVTEDNFQESVQGLISFLDEIKPYLWQSGRNYPRDTTMIERLLADNEIDFAITFNPGHASEAIKDGRLPESARSFVMKDGTIGNTHFVAIPYNSGSTAAAQVVANFLISPHAQARKADPNVWGDPTVLGMQLLSPADKKLFDDLPLGPATLTASELGNVLPEPHSSWMEKVEEVWMERYIN